MADKGEWKRLRQQLERQGLRIEHASNQHLKVFRDKELVTVLPHSAGGGRGLANQRAKLKRKGIQI